MWLGQLYAWPCEASVEIGVVSKQKVWSAYPDLLSKSTSSTALGGGGGGGLGDTESRSLV